MNEIKRLGYTWHNLYESLVLHTGKHLSTLPGRAFDADTPVFPTRRNFIDYLERYAEYFRLPIETGADVVSATRNENGWSIRLRDGRTMESNTLVVATGIVSNPSMPALPGREPPGVDGREAVDVLRRIDRGDHRAFGNLLRKRQLDEDAVDRRILVEPVDQSQQLILRDGVGQAVLEAFHARFARRLALGADIDRGRGVFPNQHHCEAGSAAGRFAELCDFAADLLPERERRGLSVDPLRGHAP